LPKKGLIELAVVIAGLGLASYGTWLAWAPGGFIVPGAALVAIGLFA